MIRYERNQKFLNSYREKKIIINVNKNIILIVLIFVLIVDRFKQMQKCNVYINVNNQQITTFSNFQFAK